MRVRVEQIMTAPVETLDGEAPAAFALEAMKRSGIHHVVVLDRGNPAGIISEGDVRGRDLRGLFAQDVMTEDVEMVSPTATIKELANRMRGRSIGCLPVFDGKHVIGIVTVSDLLELIGKGMVKPVVRARRWTLRHNKPLARTLRRE